MYGVTLWLLSLASYKETPDPIDWSHYKRTISKPNLVDDFQKKFEAISVPYPKDTASSAIEEQKNKTVKYQVLGSILPVFMQLASFRRWKSRQLLKSQSDE